VKAAARPRRESGRRSLRESGIHLDLVRERAIVMHEELLSRIAQEQNERMYVLSIVAAIFLPLSFVTGLLGMNVGGLPGVDSQLGFAGSVVVMVAVAVGLIAFFRGRKWL